MVFLCFAAARVFLLLQAIKDFYMVKECLRAGRGFIYGRSGLSRRAEAERHACKPRVEEALLTAE